MDIISIVNIVAGLGIDLGIVLFIIVTTNILKTIIPADKTKIAPFLTIILGGMIGIIQIFFAKLPSELWLRSILGYPGVSMAVYMLIKKYFINMKKEDVKKNENP